MGSRSEEPLDAQRVGTTGGQAAGSFSSLDAYLLELKGDHAGIFLKRDFRGADVAPGGVGAGPPAIWTDGLREREWEGFRGGCVVGERSFRSEGSLSSLLSSPSTSSVSKDKIRHDQRHIQEQ